jgi:hypothetical protein
MSFDSTGILTFHLDHRSTGVESASVAVGKQQRRLGGKGQDLGIIVHLPVDAGVWSIKERAKVGRNTQRERQDDQFPSPVSHATYKHIAYLYRGLKLLGRFETFFFFKATSFRPGECVRVRIKSRAGTRATVLLLVVGRVEGDILVQANGDRAPLNVKLALVGKSVRNLQAFPLGCLGGESLEGHGNAARADLCCQSRKGGHHKESEERSALEHVVVAALCMGGVEKKRKGKRGCCKCPDEFSV